MGDILQDPLGVFDDYTEDEKRKLKDRMYDPFVDSSTEWVTTEEGKRIKWMCGECEGETFFRIRYATVRCQSCLRTMQDPDHDTDSRAPDPGNPDEYLEEVAKRHGFHRDKYKEQPEQQSARSW